MDRTVDVNSAVRHGSEAPKQPWSGKIAICDPSETTTYRTADTPVVADGFGAGSAPLLAKMTIAERCLPGARYTELLADDLR